MNSDDELRLETLKQTLLTLKARVPSREAISPYYPEHPAYWLLLKMCHSGQPEVLSTIAAQLGIPEIVVSTLVDTRSGPDFPLSIRFNPITRKDTVHIDPEVVDVLRSAARQVSPEHMPTSTLKCVNHDRFDTTAPEFYFQRFSQAHDISIGSLSSATQPEDLLSSLYEYPVQEVVSLLRATVGLDDCEIVERDGGVQLIRVITPNVQMVLMPVISRFGAGNLTDRMAVLDLRDVVQDNYSAAYPKASTFPVMLSLGFSLSARMACLREPKVLLMELWAFLRLVGAIQNAGRSNSGQMAIDHIMRRLSGPSNSGRFLADGFVNHVIDELS